jgi:ABC-2 type transport system ATP-binding protein
MSQNGSPGSQNLVEARGLNKMYPRGIVAVKDLDLTVRRGEVYGFLGPNGAGKTTTLRMLLGLVRPTSGQALVAGAPPGSHESLAKVGAMVETPAFWPYLSGRDNLRLLARYCAIPDSRVPVVLDEVELAARAKSDFSTYSMGMKQRLGVAAALLKEPELLILDEPTNGLDPQGMADFRAMIMRVGQGDRTVLLSSHLLGEVEQICTRVGVINRGRIVFEGSVDEMRGGTYVEVRATPIDAARAALERVVGSDRVRLLDGGIFNLSVDPSQAADINRRLIEEGVSVYELKASERSLEDVFMELTGTEAGL